MVHGTQGSTKQGEIKRRARESTRTNNFGDIEWLEREREVRVNSYVHKVRAN